MIPPLPNHKNGCLILNDLIANPNDTPPPAYLPPPVKQNPFTKPDARPPG
jgi:hypothetical protein